MRKSRQSDADAMKRSVKMQVRCNVIRGIQICQLSIIIVSRAAFDGGSKIALKIRPDNHDHVLPTSVYH